MVMLSGEKSHSPNPCMRNINLAFSLDRELNREAPKLFSVSCYHHFVAGALGKSEFGAQTDWSLSLITSCVALGKFLCLSEPHL